MATMTITEALAELHTIDKRIEKKEQFVRDYLMRQSIVVDPLAKDGGAVAKIAAERQAIGDLRERRVSIRRAIQAANAATPVTIEGQTRTLADWLVWRRESAPKTQAFLGGLRTAINNVRAQLLPKGGTVSQQAEPKENTILVNIDESELARDIEKLELILGTLDGQLSLKNATITVEV